MHGIYDHHRWCMKCPVALFIWVNFVQLWTLKKIRVYDVDSGLHENEKDRESGLLIISGDYLQDGWDKNKLRVRVSAAWSGGKSQKNSSTPWNFLRHVERIKNENAYILYWQTRRTEDKLIDAGVKEDIRKMGGVTKWRRVKQVGRE